MPAPVASPPRPEPSTRPPDAAHTEAVRNTLDRSESGAPAAGHAVRDLFSTDEIFQRLVATADEEFVRSARLLFLSGLAAGLSIGLTFIARATLTAAVAGGAEPTGAEQLVGNLLYPVGFLFIVLGRYQLFTENTLTPVTLVLTRIASLPMLLRVWGIVLAANVLGAALVALVLAQTAVLDPDAAAVARAFGEHGLHVPASALFWKGLVAGWIVASMVWLTHAARDTVTRFLTVMVLMYLVPTAGLFHCIIGACEVLYLVFLGEATLGAAGVFFGAVVVGNTVGGVLLVAILNYAQTRQQRFPERGETPLTWREFMFGYEAGQMGHQVTTPAEREAGERGSLLDRPVGTTADEEDMAPADAHP